MLSRMLTAIVNISRFYPPNLHYGLVISDKKGNNKNQFDRSNFNLRNDVCNRFEMELSFDEDAIGIEWDILKWKSLDIL